VDDDEEEAGTSGCCFQVGLRDVEFWLLWFVLGDGKLIRSGWVDGLVVDIPIRGNRLLPSCLLSS
jgi:hypothetical protein